MQAELKIKSILANEGSVKDKVKAIGEFMDWSKDKLEKAILDYGTHSNEQITKIIKRFWG